MTPRDDQSCCCPRFDPERWNEKTVTWTNAKFVQDRVRSFLHIPLNFSAVMVRNCRLIEAAGAQQEEPLVLADENSLWGADVFIGVTRDVPQAKMATLSGTFLCKVFEGPYSNIRSWIKEMQGYVASQGKGMQRLLFYYTTCPRCAKKYGKNYVVLLAQIA